MQQSIVTSQDLHDIPRAARSFADIAYMAPGTVPVEPSDPTKARITAVSFGGSSGLNVQLSVDGGDNTDDYIGGFLQNFSLDSIQEFAVQISQEYANIGRTVGGAVVISTKRGADQWHGNAAFYERAAPLNARNVLDNPEPKPKRLSRAEPPRRHRRPTKAGQLARVLKNQHSLLEEGACCGECRGKWEGDEKRNGKHRGEC